MHVAPKFLSNTQRHKNNFLVGRCFIELHVTRFSILFHVNSLPNPPMPFQCTFINVSIRVHHWTHRLPPKQCLCAMSKLPFNSLSITSVWTILQIVSFANNNKSATLRNVTYQNWKIHFISQGGGELLLPSTKFTSSILLSSCPVIHNPLNRPNISATFYPPRLTVKDDQNTQSLLLSIWDPWCYFYPDWYTSRLGYRAVLGDTTPGIDPSLLIRSIWHKLTVKQGNEQPVSIST